MASTGRPLALRPVDMAEASEYFGVLATCFGEAHDAEEQRVALALFSAERSLAAFEGPTMIGTAGSFALSMTAPGGVARVAGVTAVGVLPTHRRRGVLTALMRRQLDDLHRSREPVAALWASEASIYGRFGYGVGSRHLRLRVPTKSAFVRGAPGAGGTARLVEPAQVRAEIAAVYEAVRADRPGNFALSAPWWDHWLADPESRREGASPLQCVLHEGPEGIDGYAVYAVKGTWDDHGLAAGTVAVRSTAGTTPAATAAIWRYLLDLDLMDSVEILHRPLDDPLLSLLGDARRASARLTDGLWVRLVDVGAALAARSYAAPLDAVLDVVDPVCPWNAGRWRLESAGAAGGARCARTTDPPDAVVPVAVLGGAWLGGGGFSADARAGLLEERRAGTVDALGAAFGWPTAPHCPFVF